MAEGARLESVYTLTGIGGSNPSLSAISEPPWQNKKVRQIRARPLNCCCWHLGASIKDAGNKAFAISEMLSTCIRSAVKADVEASWTRATSVAI